jgi:malate dehydrogenase (oxaloacetate-decarboxylating)(NADP+)
MNKYKEKFAIKTEARTLEDALIGADVFIGVSVKDVLTEKMLLSMAKNPVIFAMANPNPEIKPEIAKSIRSDVIIATGRGDYPNQVNNVLCFPYLFRGALDVQATKITIEMKVAVAEALAKIAQLPVPDYIKDMFPSRVLEFGPEYIIPTPFDKRNLIEIAPKVAEIAMQLGLARKQINITEYKKSLEEKELNLI